MQNRNMALLIVAALAVAPIAWSAARSAGVAGTGSTANATFAGGWSAKKSLIGHDVYDGRGTKIGKIADLLLNRATGAASALVGVGGFLGIDERYVRIGVDTLKRTDSRLIWPGVTRDRVGAMPAVDRARLDGDYASLDRSVLGRTVYNKGGESIGKIADVIAAPGKPAVAILDVGSYLATGEHDVAVPTSSLVYGDHLRLPDATQESLRAMPPVR